MFGLWVSIDLCVLSHHRDIHHWAAVECPVVARRPQHAISKLACIVLHRSSAGSCRSVFVQVVFPPLGWSPLSSFLVMWSPSVDTRCPSVVFEAVDVPCPGPFQFSHITDYMYDFCGLPDPDVDISILLCDVGHIFLSILFCAAVRWLCAFLVSVHGLCTIGLCHSWQHLIIRQMARLILKISRCLSYADQPAMYSLYLSVLVLFLVVSGPKSELCIFVAPPWGL